MVTILDLSHIHNVGCMCYKTHYTVQKEMLSEIAEHLTEKGLWTPWHHADLLFLDEEKPQSKEYLEWEKINKWLHKCTPITHFASFAFKFYKVTLCPCFLDNCYHQTVYGREKHRMNFIFNNLKIEGAITGVETSYTTRTFTVDTGLIDRYVLPDKILEHNLMYCRPSLLKFRDCWENIKNYPLKFETNICEKYGDYDYELHKLYELNKERIESYFRRTLQKIKKLTDNDLNNLLINKIYNESYKQQITAPFHF